MAVNATKSKKVIELQTIHFKDDDDAREFTEKIVRATVNLRFSTNYYNENYDPKARRAMQYWGMVLDELLVMRGITIHQKLESVKILKHNDRDSP